MAAWTYTAYPIVLVVVFRLLDHIPPANVGISVVIVLFIGDEVDCRGVSIADM